jgi:hypothetical protein
MATIKTRISTNKDPSIDELAIMEGHPMWPGAFMLNFAVNPYGTIFDQNITPPLFDGRLKIVHAGFYGIYGPAWAARADVEATSSEDGSSIEMSVKDDKLKAGIEWGASHTVQFTFNGSVYTFLGWKWESTWWGGYPWPEFGWKPMDNPFNQVISLDFILLAYILIKIIWAKKNKELADKEYQDKVSQLSELANKYKLTWDEIKNAMPEPPVPGISKRDILIPTAWTVRDVAEDTFNNTGMTFKPFFDINTGINVGGKFVDNGAYMEMKAYPGIVQALDIWQFLVYADKLWKSYGGTIEFINSQFEFLHIDFEIGIKLGVVFPLQVDLKNICFSGAVYDVHFDSGTKKVTGTKQNPAPQMDTYNAVGPSKDLELYFKFSTGFDIRFGLFATFTWVKFISLSFSVDWNILEDWGLQPGPDPSKVNGVFIGGGAAYSGFAEPFMDDVEVVFA